MQIAGRRFFDTMPSKLLGLTIIFVLIAEILVFIPSVANFRVNWLNDRIERAYLAGLTIYAADKTNSSNELQIQFSESLGIYSIVIIDSGRRIPVILTAENHQEMHDAEIINLIEDNFFVKIADALLLMLSRGTDYVMITGGVENQANVYIETTVSQTELRREMWKFAGDILGLSLVICVIVAGLVCLALFRMFVGPMVQLTGKMAAFQKDPEDDANMMQPSGRSDEFGEAEKALAQMQSKLRQALDQQKRFATLGQSVSKINHDLRNILTSAVLISDRLLRSDDPAVKRLTPRLVKSLDRAANLCTATLDYGRIEEIKPGQINLFDLVEEVSDTVTPLKDPDAQSDSDADHPHVVIENAVSADLEVICDRVQMFRALSNLLRNASQALEESGQSRPRIIITARETDEKIAIQIEDNGPGIASEVAEYLFTPFKGTTKVDGNGLGLAIVHEIVRAHEGMIDLLSTGKTGTIFQIELPHKRHTDG